MLKQNGAKIENAGKIYIIYYNPEIACSRVLQRNPNSLNIYIILLLTRKLCQSKTPSKCISCTGSFILLYSLHAVYQAQNCWKCKEVDVYTTILTLQTLGFEHKPKIPEHCITQLVKTNSEWNQHLDTHPQQKNETRFREKWYLAISATMTTSIYYMNGFVCEKTPPVLFHYDHRINSLFHSQAYQNI